MEANRACSCQGIFLPFIMSTIGNLGCVLGANRAAGGLSAWLRTFAPYVLLCRMYHNSYSIWTSLDISSRKLE